MAELCGLLKEIEKMRQVLIYVVANEGLSSQVAIQYSQELDHLLNLYDRLYSHDDPNSTSSYIQA